MPVLVLNYGGVAPITVDCQRGGHAPPRRAGGKSYGFLGAEDTDVRAELMVVPVILSPKSPAEANAIRALLALGAQFPCQGDVFNVAPGTTVVCSGKITDELDRSARWWTLNATLFEVGSELDYVPTTLSFLLTSVDSPDSGDPVTFVSTPDGWYPGDSGTSFMALAAATPVSNVTVTSSVPERSWLSVPLNAGSLTGAPYIQVETEMSGVYSGTTVWAAMSTMAKLSQVRSGAVVAGPFSSSSVGVGLGGGVGYMNFSALALSVQLMDQLLIEFFSLIRLQPGQSDNGQRQVIYYGGVPGPRSNPLLVASGSLTSYP